MRETSLETAISAVHASSSGRISGFNMRNLLSYRWESTCLEQLSRWCTHLQAVVSNAFDCNDIRPATESDAGSFD
jgi:hypothetical protein